MTLVVNISCTGSDRTKRIELNDGDALTIGRSNSDASLVVDARLSRKHFIIRYVDGHIEVEHLSKTNPTMVASQESSDFQKVKGVRREDGNCRIIAGSHRFILTLAKTDSVEMTGFTDDLSSDKTAQENHAKVWSDVDSGSGEIMSPVSERATSIDPGIVSSRPAKTIPISREEFVAEEVPCDPTTQQNVFFEDEEDEEVEVKVEKKDKPKKKKTEAKKPFFPLGDDFFDD